MLLRRRHRRLKKLRLLPGGLIPRARQSSPGLGANQFQFDRDSLARGPQGLDLAFDKVLLQAPGVTQDSSGEVHIRNEHSNVQYRLNGVLRCPGADGFGNVVDTAIANKVVLLTGALPAQYGFRTAGIVDITTASGTFDTQNESVFAAVPMTIAKRAGRPAEMRLESIISLPADIWKTRKGSKIQLPRAMPFMTHPPASRIWVFLQNPERTFAPVIDPGAYDGSFEIPNTPNVAPFV